MKKQEGPDSKKVLGLTLGIAAAVGFAGWNITQAISPAARPNSAATPTAPGAAAPQPGASRVTADNGTDTPAASVTPDTPRVMEAYMAPEADPFLPLSPAVVVQPAPPAAPSNAIPVSHIKSPGPLPSPFGKDPGPGAPTLPAVDPQPELVGTMLGEQPSAVFRGEHRVVLVPVGGSIGGWKVVSVDHGSAVVSHLGKSVRLELIGGAYQARMNAASAEPATTAEAQRPEMMASVPTGIVALPASAAPALPEVRTPDSAPTVNPTVVERTAAPSSPSGPAPESAPAPAAPAPADGK